jgi:hypothetical protein
MMLVLDAVMGILSPRKEKCTTEDIYAFITAHEQGLKTMRYAHLSPDYRRMAMEILEQRFSVKSPATFHNPHIAIPFQGHQKRVAVR